MKKTIDEISDWCARDEIDLSVINGIECLLDENNDNDNVMILLKENRDCRSNDVFIGNADNV